MTLEFIPPSLHQQVEIPWSFGFPSDSTGLEPWTKSQGFCPKEIVIRRNDIFVWDKTTKGCEQLPSTPRRVNVCKGKIWPDLHLGPEDPIPQFLQSFP